jgi:hypothetical protein
VAGLRGIVGEGAASISIAAGGGDGVEGGQPAEDVQEIGMAGGRRGSATGARGEMGGGNGVGISGDRVPLAWFGGLGAGNPRNRGAWVRD